MENKGREAMIKLFKSLIFITLQERSAPNSGSDLKLHSWVSALYAQEPTPCYVIQHIFDLWRRYDAFLPVNPHSQDVNPHSQDVAGLNGQSNQPEICCLCCVIWLRRAKEISE